MLQIRRLEGRQSHPKRIMDMENHEAGTATLSTPFCWRCSQLAAGVWYWEQHLSLVIKCPKSCSKDVAGLLPASRSQNSGIGRNAYAAWPQSAMTTGLAVLPDWEPTASIFFTTSMPSTTAPNTTCLPSNHWVFTVHKKNWDPLVLGPALAIDKIPGPVCLRVKFSSANFAP